MIPVHLQIAHLIQLAQEHVSQIIGFLGLGVAMFIGATAAADSALLVGAILGILVALSTLLIRLFVVVDGRVTRTIERMQALGDLPTKLERQENSRALEALDLKIDEILDEIRGGHL